MKYYSIILLSCLIVLNSCIEDKQEIILDPEKNETEAVKLSVNRPNLNISILLDLSDRIDPKKYPNPAMEFYQRDLGYINSVANSFEWHLRNKRSIKINDHIQLFIDPEPSDSDLNKKMRALNLNFTRANATKENILKTSVIYDSITKQIYQSAIADNNYIGSDIWRFFKNNVKDYCIEEGHRNILVVLTDGYLYHKDNKIKESNSTTYLRPQDIRYFKLNTSNWKDKLEQGNYGFIVPRTDLENLEVLVLGINPDTKNPYEQDVITLYWENWLSAMN
ncbi:MAG: hypothetical protein WA749_00550, partial [Gelidibacter sp.]